MTAETIVSIAQLAEESEKLPSLIRMACMVWRKHISSHAVVLVYGESGAGKTQFLNKLCHINPSEAERVPPRTRDFRYYSLVLPDGHIIDFVDIPGHKVYKSIREDVRNKIRNGEICGLINVVANGYLYADEVDDKTVFRGNSNEVKSTFIKNNLKKELEQISEWKDCIGCDSAVDWVVTIVNKADIWFNQKDSVLEYYTSGIYHKTISDLQHSCSLHVLPCCSIINPLGGRPMQVCIGDKEKHEFFEEIRDSITKLVYQKWNKKRKK